jgi:acetyl esterase
MPVDPEIVEMLAASRAAKPVPIDGIPLDEVRNGYRLKYAERSLEPSEEVSWEDIHTGSAHRQVALRIYRPADKPRPMPAIIYLHGGGFVLGDTAAYHRQSGRIASLCRAAVIFVEYRLAPEHPFPAAYDDAIAAARYVLENRDELGLDTDRIMLMGDSAGANLALGTAMALGGGASLRHLCLLYPVVDFRPYVGSSLRDASDTEFEKGFGLDFDTMRFFGRHYLGCTTNADDPRVSPLLSQRLDMLPPTAIFAAGNDVLRDQGRRFTERLKREGGVVNYVLFDTLIHNFMGHAAVSRQSDLAFQAVCHQVIEVLHRGRDS